MSFIKKAAIFDDEGNRISDYYEDIHISNDERFAVVERTREFEKEYNFIKPDGSLLSKQWFCEVDDFEPKYDGVKVVMYDPKQGHNISAILLDNGKIILRKGLYLVETNLIDGLAVVRKAGKKNIVNREGKLLSKKWFYNIANINYKGYIIVEEGKNTYNIITREGRRIFKKPAERIIKLSEDYLVAISADKNYIYTFKIADGSEVYSTKISAYSVYENEYPYEAFFKIRNNNYEWNIISSTTAKPIFKEWKKDITCMNVSERTYFYVKEADGFFSLYDIEGKKITKHKCAYISNRYHDKVKLCYYTKTNRRKIVLLNVNTGEIETVREKK